MEVWSLQQGFFKVKVEEFAWILQENSLGSLKFRQTVRMRTEYGQIKSWVKLVSRFQLSQVCARFAAPYWPLTWRQDLKASRWISPRIKILKHRHSLKFSWTEPINSLILILSKIHQQVIKIKNQTFHSNWMTTTQTFLLLRLWLSKSG